MKFYKVLGIFAFAKSFFAICQKFGKKIIQINSKQSNSFNNFKSFQQFLGLVKVLDEVNLNNI